MRTTRKDIVKGLLALFVAGLAATTLFFMAARLQAAFASDKAQFRHSTAFYRYQWLEGRERKAGLRRTLRRQQAEIQRLHLRIKASQAAPYGSHPIERNMLCIHGGEGSWTDPNAPYYGGMQMDEQFAKTYGRWAWDYFGSPDHWPISVQLSVSIQAMVSGRGYYPWPTTARACGLI